MKEKVILGIDTSNYTTSFALLGAAGELIANLKRPLVVKTGERGLRQSDAVFAHIKNIPELANDLRKYLSNREIVAVGVSERPRNVDGSYMPCFLPGVSVAESVSSALGVPLHRFSHQCGHIMAALYSSGKVELTDSEFCAFHISGGTTEMLRVGSAKIGFTAQLVGATADLNAGQVIDRVGVRLGLPFPCGVHIEKLALNNVLKFPHRKPVLNDMKVNFSGLENMALKLYEDTGSKEAVSAFVLDYVTKCIILLADAYIDRFGASPMVFAGGVMSNSIIKSKLKDRYDAYFAEPALSADNAVGIATLTRRAYLAEK